MSIAAADEVVKPLKLFQELVFEIAGEPVPKLAWLHLGIQWPVGKLIYRGRPTQLYMQSSNLPALDNPESKCPRNE